MKESVTGIKELGKVDHHIDLVRNIIHMYDGTEMNVGDISVFVPDGMGSGRLFQDEEQLKFAMKNPEIDNLLQSIKNEIDKVIK